ncbi:MAG: hypothetical protein K0S65_3226 [Labilithrix sp.]|jgi:hypothetical protein|nr:hypothetical protein [Labilithrix sp.]
MGGCNCGKSTPTGYGTPLTAEQRAQQAAIQAQSQQPTNAAQAQAVASGQPMGFALRTSDGRVQSFGSALERNAEKARRGGTII